MRLANSTTAAPIKVALFLSFFCSIFISTEAQDNSPLSRYGMGDLVPNTNIINRSLGGVAAGYADYQSINLANPASLGNIPVTVFDFGAEVDVRNLRSNTSPEKYTSANLNVSYLQIGFPILSKKIKKTSSKKDLFWGASFGLRPVSRVSYSIATNSRIANIDSVQNLYEGSGGLNQANISMGFSIKNLSLGFSSGYTFGNKDFSSRRTFISDSVAYYRGSVQQESSFGGVFLNLGAQYTIKTKSGILRLGASSNLQQTLKGRKDVINETFTTDVDGNFRRVDSVSVIRGKRGEVTMPATYAFGFTFTTQNWLVGADLDVSNWKDYSFFGTKDPAVANNYFVKAGVQYLPAKGNTPTNKYWSFVNYRFGAYYGNDYIKINENRPEYGVTLGAGLPLTSFSRLRTGEYVTLNTALEYGIRGNKNNVSLRENVTRISFGVTMNARWFQKYKYQ